MKNFLKRKKRKKHKQLVKKQNDKKQLDEIPMEIKIERSARRIKTVSARLIDNVMLVKAPAQIPDVELGKIIDNLKEKLYKKKIKRELNATEDLTAIAQYLNDKYFNGSLNIASIEYVTSQNRRFGSCSCRTRQIRISHRLATVPHWVRDYVVIHEMAHLIEPNHGKTFWDIVYRYELTERSIGYLMAKGLDAESDYSE